MKNRARTIAAAVLGMTLVLTGCGSTLSPEDVAWDKIGEGPIVAMDSSAGVYVSGYMSSGMFGGHGEIESEGVIDYKYARELDDGGVREDLVSTTYQRFSPSLGPNDGKYPGSRVVTIYQDAEPDGSDARIEIFECALPENVKAENEKRAPVDSTYLPDTCRTPSGTALDRYELRVDVHVPPGSVVEKYDDQDEEDGS
ncbi:hypothetical protein [Brevibacterium oceani]|uniref:hypothetical protein n=1 Tax=Brevibacterium oceani TaxID=358099 RepID=UPI0015E66B61|nr:hypothetical protein [Brevibacterium oceani]